MPAVISRRTESVAPVLQCPGCGGGDFVERHVADFLHTRTCRSCGLILGSTSRHKPKLGQYANVDLRAYNGSVGVLRHEQSAEIIDFLRPHVPPGARVLDVGCGFGGFLIRARDAGYAVAGIEPDAHACAGACRVLGEGTVTQGTLPQVKPPARSADVVTTLDVLEHVPLSEHAAFARVVANTLTPGGIWAIKVPSSEGLYYRISALLAGTVPQVGATFLRRLWQAEYEFPHTVYFDRPSLRRWLQRHGFSVFAHRYLAEVPVRRIIDRLTHDGDIGRAQAYAMVPSVCVINAIEWIRRRSDALVVLARPV